MPTALERVLAALCPPAHFCIVTMACFSLGFRYPQPVAAGPRAQNAVAAQRSGRPVLPVLHRALVLARVGLFQNHTLA